MHRLASPAARSTRSATDAVVRRRGRRCVGARSMLPADGDVVVFDPIGGPIAVALAEELGARAILVTQDHIAGNELSRTGDLAPANVRLARAGVRIERRTLLRAVRRRRRPRSRTGSRGPAARSPARRSSTAASACPTSRCPARRRRPATASPRGPSTRRSSRAAAWPSRCSERHARDSSGELGPRNRPPARRQNRFRARRAAWRPHMPWTPAPGGVEAEQR